MCGNIKSKPRFYAWYWIYVPRIFNYAQFGGKEGRLAVCRKRGKLFINTRKDVLL